MSRLSNRTTRNPFSASPWQSASGQKMSWAPKPMMSRTSGSPSRPKLSYSMSIPFARNCGMTDLQRPAVNLAENPPSSTRPALPDSGAHLSKRPRALVHRLPRSDPFEAGELVARPGELPLGVMAGVELRARRGLLKRQPALEMGGEMGNPMGAHHRQRRIEPPLLQRRDFLERAVGEHGVEAGVDTLIELGSIGREVEPRPLARPKRRRSPRAEKRDERAPGRGPNLERAQDSLSVAHVEAGRRLGIARLKLGVELRRGAVLRLAPNLSAHRFRHRGQVRQALGQRAKIKARAADENDRTFAGLGQNLARRPRPSSGRE